MIKFLADENVPIEAVKALKRKGLDIVSIIEFLTALNDKEVLDLANRENRILINFDKYFGELVVKEKVRIKGLILLRFAPKSPQEIAMRIWQILTSQIPIENNLLIMKEYAVRLIKLKF